MRIITKLSLRLKDIRKRRGIENKSKYARAGYGTDDGTEVFPIRGKPGVPEEEKVRTDREISKSAGVGHNTLYKVSVLEEKLPAEIYTLLLSCNSYQ